MGFLYSDCSHIDKDTDIEVLYRLSSLVLSHLAVLYRFRE